MTFQLGNNYQQVTDVLANFIGSQADVTSSPFAVGDISSYPLFDTGGFATMPLGVNLPTALNGSFVPFGQMNLSLGDSFGQTANLSSLSMNGLFMPPDSMSLMNVVKANPQIFNQNLFAMPKFELPSFDFLSNVGLSTVKPKLGDGYNLKLSKYNKQELAKIKDIFNKNRDKYETVARATGVPAELICAIHYREGGCDFSTYLHNGEPLGKPTTKVPVGKMFNNWTDAAIDAIKSQPYYKNVSRGNISSQLEYAERYNGLGYRNKGVESPYVWAATDKYNKGMYVKDGVYDASAKDKRVGVAAIIDSLYTSA